MPKYAETAVPHVAPSFDVPWSPQENVGTHVGCPPRAHEAPLSLPAVLPFIERQLRQLSEPGVLVAALGSAGIYGRSWSRSTDSSPHALSIGRHTHAGLVLPGDEELSLRHLLLVTQRQEGRVRFQLMDLRSTAGSFVEVTGNEPKALGKLEHDGLLVVRAARWMLIAAPTGCLDAAGPNTSEEPSLTLLSRSRIVELSSCRVPPGPSNTLPPEGQESSRSGELHVRPVVAPHEPVVGDLVVRQGADERRVPVGGAALERGILVGREPRCDVIFGSQGVSRVHCLLFQNPWTFELCVADAGSTNGTHVDSREVQCASLRSGVVVHLASEAVSFRWISNTSAAC